MKEQPLALSVESRQPELSTSSSRTAARSGCARPAAADADALLEFFEGLSRAQPLPALPRDPAVDAALAEPLLEPDWDERGALVGWLGDRVVARRELRAAARPGGRRGRLRGRRRPSGPRHRHAPARAAGRRARPAAASSASSPRCCAENRADARRLRRRRLRRRARARAAARSRSASRSPRPSATARASRSATTSPSPPRCARSSSRAPSP